MIAAKKDIAFVDFGDEASSTLAKEALNGHKVGEGDDAAPMKVSTRFHFISALAKPSLVISLAMRRRSGGGKETLTLVAGR